jgi:hypothetical protein
MKRISLTEFWYSMIRGVERELYLLRLEEADILKMDQAYRKGSPLPSPRHLETRAEIAKKMDYLADLQSTLAEVQELERQLHKPPETQRPSSYSKAQQTKRNRGLDDVKLISKTLHRCLTNSTGLEVR